MPDESINPYAAPTVTTPLPPEPVRGSCRMSEASLKTAVRLMVVSEVTFAAGWILFFVTMATPYDFNFWARGLTFWGAFVCFLISWIFTIGLVFQCRGVGTLLMALIIPVPILGSFAFLGCITHTRQTFIVNGYEPGFLGASPDEAERVAMAADPIYRPSLNFDKQGDKRNLTAAMTHILLAIMVLGFTALMALA